MINWTPGQQLGQNGKYIIQDLIGGGGFGNTYRAIIKGTNSLVAIKTLNIKEQSKPDFPQRQVKFVNEAVKLAKCSHPNIVEVLEVIEEGGLWGMVMEYVPGVDLATYVEDSGVLSEAEALKIVQQVGEALTFVHQRRLLHRDVKPNNIILRQNTVIPVLIDFGLAREVTPGILQSMTNQITECFAPIEQYERHGEFGAYTDVYALAATLYALLTGKLPIPAHFRKDADIPLPKPNKYNSQISDRTNVAILLGMELQPENRPQSVQEWLDMLLPNSVSLLSAVGMDYTRLQNLLKAGKWKEADEETYRVMLKVVGREDEGWLDDEDIENFPCDDLRTINQLWLDSSNGRFGFSVQKQIWLECGGKIDYETEKAIGKAIGDRIGWRVNNEWIDRYSIRYSLDAPPGHLPLRVLWIGLVVRGFGVVRWFELDLNIWGRGMVGLFSRVQRCQL